VGAGGGGLVSRPWERGLAPEWVVVEALQAIAAELRAGRGLVGRRVRLEVTHVSEAQPEGQVFEGEVLFADLDPGTEEIPSYLVLVLVLEGGLTVTRWIVPGEDTLEVLP
jgi:hypothetical protein